MMPAHVKYLSLLLHGAYATCTGGMMDCTAHDTELLFAHHRVGIDEERRSSANAAKMAVEVDKILVDSGSDALLFIQHHVTTFARQSGGDVGAVNMDEAMEDATEIPIQLPTSKILKDDASKSVLLSSRRRKHNHNHAASVEAVASKRVLSASSCPEDPPVNETMLSSSCWQTQCGKPVSKLYFLNMDSAEERRQTMKRCLPKDVPTERLPGVEVDSALFERLQDSYDFCCALWPPQENKGAIGCYASYMQFVEQVCQRTLPGVGEGDLVMMVEDDVYLSKSWRKSLSVLAHELPTDWVLARIGSWGNQSEVDRVNQFWFRAVNDNPLFRESCPKERREIPNRFPGGPKNYSRKYGGTQAMLFEVGKRSDPLCQLARSHTVCHVDMAWFNSIDIKSYVVDHRYSPIFGHSLENSDRAKYNKLGYPSAGEHRSPSVPKQGGPSSGRPKHT